MTGIPRNHALMQHFDRLPWRTWLAGVAVLMAAACGKGQSTGTDAGAAPGPTDLSVGPTSTVIGAPAEPTLTFALPAPEPAGVIGGGAAADEPLIFAFSEPMVPLAAVDQPQEWTGTVVEPPLALRWRWLTTDTVAALPLTATGEPGGTWPPATTVRVQLPRDLKTRDGRPFSAPIAHTFQTLAPQLAWSEPATGTTFLARNMQLTLVFNQAVTDAEVAKHLVLEPMRPGVEIPAHTVRRPTTRELTDLRAAGRAVDAEAAVVVTFASMLPPWEGFRARIHAGLHGAVGTRTSVREDLVTWETSGPESVADPTSLAPFKPKTPIMAALLAPEDHELAQIAFTAELAPGDKTPFLKVTPKLAKGNASLDCWDNVCTIRGDFQPETTYTATIAGTLQDAHGRTLGAPVTITGHFGHFRPWLDVYTEGTVMEARQAPHAMTVEMRNLRQVTARAWPVPVTTPTAVLAHLRPDDPGYADAIARLGTPTTLDLAASTQPDTLERRRLDLDKVLAGKSGNVWVELVTPDVRRDPERPWAPNGHEGRLYQVTDLHVGVKSSPKESLVWVTSLQTGQPVAGAKVSVRDEHDAVVWRGTTSADGLALGPGEPTGTVRSRDTARVVWVEKDADVARLPWIQSGDWSPWMSDEEREGQRGERGWMFSDKPLYRLGEAVQVKGLLRLAGKDALSLPPAGEEGTLELVDPSGKAVQKQPIRLSARGTFAATLNLPTVAEYGQWSVDARFKGYRFVHRVDVAVYHVPKAQVHLTLPDAHVTVGEPAHGQLTAAWFSGGPLNLAPAHVAASGYSNDFVPPGWPGYQFADDVWHESSASGARNYLSHEAKGKTDAHGVWSFAIPTRVPMDRALKIDVDASVEDPNGRPMSTSGAFWVHPAAVTLGLGEDSALQPAGEPRALHVVAVTPDGHAQAGLQAQVTLLRQEWKSIREKGMGGEVSWSTRLVETPAGSCKVTTQALPVDCTLTAPEAGAYVVRGTVRDRAGRTAVASASLYAYGAGGAPWDPDEGNLLVADKASYKVGETAHILVKNPAPQTLALVTEERAGIVRSRLQRLEGLTPVIDVPIEGRHAPNIQIGVVVISPRRADGALGVDSGAPSLRSSSVTLEVDPGDHRLVVTLTPEQTQLAPGQKTSVEVTVRDAAGRPRAAEVTLWAVDEGVLALTGEATPDAFPTMYAPIYAAVRDVWLMDNLVRRRAGELKGEDGGGGGDGADVRTALRDVAFWQPAIEVGADGKARHTFTLPDNLTTWRIMAVATDGPGDFGSGDVQVIAQKPLMVQPAVPKSVATGDVVALTATVRNREKHALKTTVTVAVDGPLALTGPREVTVTLAPDQGQEVAFMGRATGAGHVKLTWTAEAKGARDSVAEALDVRDLQPPETIATWAQVTGNRAEVLHKDGLLLPDVGGLDVEVATSLVVGTRVAVQALVDYPFDCSEQLASRLQGLLALDTLRKREPTLFADLAPDHRVLAQGLVDKLETRMLSGGGVSLWPGSVAYEPATVWALWVLADAKAHGLTVDEERVRLTGQWLAAQTPHAQPAQTQAALAAVGLANDVTRQALLDQRATLTADERTWLALSYVAQPTQPAGRQALDLADQLLAHVRTDGEFAWPSADPVEQRGVWGSDVQAAATLVELVAKARPDHPLQPRLTRWLARQQGAHGWGNTHENALALRALAAQLATTVPPTGQVTVTVDAKPLLSGALTPPTPPVLRGHLAQSALTAGDHTIQLTHTGEGPLWLRIAWQFARQTPPEEGRNHGFLVRRHVLDLQGQPIRGPIKRGETVLIQVEVTAADPWTDVAVVDRPPAGLEPVDLQFASHDAGLLRKLEHLTLGSAAPSAYVEHQEQAGREVRWFVTLQRGPQVLRYLARAATRGTFVGAGTQAEAMYRPEISGTSGATHLTIE